MSFNLNTVFQFLTPKDKKFFPLFRQSTKNLIQLAELLHEAVNAPLIEREELFNKMTELNEIGEQIAHKTYIELNKNFITPFDREDIYSLVNALDNVADYIHGASSRMRLYQVEKITKSIRKLTEINLEACQHLDIAIKELENFKNLKKVIESCNRINKLESKSDNVYDKAVYELFENETDAKNIIKYKEVLSALETATDKCKSTASVLESITVKHS
jgi:predicted phosphate transport protein (TIGR00153 family)